MNKKRFLKGFLASNGNKHFFSVPFLIILLITAFAPVVDSQNPYLSSNFPELFNPLEFSYQFPAFFYTNDTINPKWLSLTSPFKPADRYSIPFSQPDFTNYFFQPTPNWPSGMDYPFLLRGLSSSYQNPFNSFNDQLSLMQDRGSPNINMTFPISYPLSAMGDMPFVYSIGSYPSLNYPGYHYRQEPWVPGTLYYQQHSSKIIGTIGIITDIHYTDKDSTDRRLRYSFSGPRFYSEAGDDLGDFVSKMNSMGVDAAIELGDFIDIHSGNSVEEGNSNTHDDGAHGETILFEAESIYSNLNMPYYHVIGNWDMCDYDFVTAGDWFQYIINGTHDTIQSLGGELYTDAIGNPVSRYYSFKFGRVLGIALDSSSSGVSGDNYLMHTTGINGSGYVPKKQLNWLEGILADNRAGENRPVIVFIHTFLYPVVKGNNYYMCRNHSDVRDILEDDDNVIAVFNGHHHPGARGWWEDTHDDPDSNVYHTATGVFGKKHNGIRYYNLRASVISWGSDSADPIKKPSNVYYVLTVKKRLSISIEVQSFRTN